MSLSYQRRKKVIRAEKKQRGTNFIPEKEFRQLQADWERQVIGSPICSLQDLIDGRSRTATS